MAGSALRVALEIVRFANEPVGMFLLLGFNALLRINIRLLLFEFDKNANKSGS